MYGLLKRLVDLVLSLVLLILLSPVIIGIIVLMIARKEWPVFYISERMRSPTEPFQLIKFRTMSPPKSQELNLGVSGGEKNTRITKLGATLRKFRLDELPQIINVLRGDMSFVGPRPPLRQYTEKFPDLYAEVLRVKPGITGFATLHFHRHEAYLLSQSQSQEDTEQIYTRRCIPRKAKLDLLYQRNANICSDLWLMVYTVLRVLKKH